MAKFDPDAYLKETAPAFDPDEYLGIKTQPRGTVPVEEPRSVSGFLSNIPSSAGKFFGGLVEAVTSPAKTAGALLDIAAGGIQKTLPKNVVDFVNQLDTPEGQEAAKRAADTASAVGGMYAQRYGSLEGIKKAAYEDPVGVAGDLSALLSMGAGAVRAVPAATQTGFKVAKSVPAFQNQAALTAIPQQIAAVAKPTANVLETAARYTNPLTPITAGFSGLKKAVGGAVQTPQMQEAVTTAREAGYVIPPSQARDSVINKTLEGVAGKTSVSQAASVKNQVVTNRLANETLGLAPDVQLTPAVLDSVRAEAGKAYEAVANLGELSIPKGQKLPSEVAIKVKEIPFVRDVGELGIRSPLPLEIQQKFHAEAVKNAPQSVDAGELVRAWKQANADATTYYRKYNGPAPDPEDLTKAKYAENVSKQISSFLDSQLKSKGLNNLLSDLKAARVQIAKTYSVEKALNPVTGNVDAKKLAAQLEKGKVLSGGLKTAGQFASQFKQAAQMPEKMGSTPGISPVDVVLGGLGATLFGDFSGAAVGFGRPALRGAALSKTVQNRLIQRQGMQSPITAKQINYLNSLLQAQQAQGTQ